MTVEQLSTEMGYAELVEWSALDEIRAQERKTAEAQAKKGMRPRRFGRRR